MARSISAGLRELDAHSIEAPCEDASSSWPLVRKARTKVSY